MIRTLWGLVFHDRLDRMTQNEIEEMSESGELTFAEVKRLIAADRQAGTGKR